MNIDQYIFHSINQFAGIGGFLDKAAVFFSDYLQYAILLVFLLLLVKNFKKYFLLVFSVFVSAFLSRIVITEVIRYFYIRPRPFVTEEANVILNQSAAEPSMPSGHAALFFAVAATVYFYNKKAGVLFFAAAFLISISRVFAGIHWPSDILVGAAIGLLSAWLVKIFFQKFSKQKTPQ